MLAAPTGRAARRMSEATGMGARTIHRLLEVSGGAPDSDAARIFQRNADNPLETDVVVVDEMSMVDLPLFRSLLRAIAPGTRLIMVGDEHQLPSVGPGSVLKDLIASKQFEMVTLKKIDVLIEHSAHITAMAINTALQPFYTSKDLEFLVK